MRLTFLSDDAPQNAGISEEMFLFDAIEDLHKELWQSRLDADDLDAIDEMAHKYWSLAGVHKRMALARLIGATYGGVQLGFAAEVDQANDLEHSCQDIIDLIRRWKKLEDQIAQIKQKLAQDQSNVDQDLQQKKLQQFNDAFGRSAAYDGSPDNAGANFLGNLGQAGVGSALEDQKAQQLKKDIGDKADAASKRRLHGIRRPRPRIRGNGSVKWAPTTSAGWLMRTSRKTGLCSTAWRKSTTTTASSGITPARRSWKKRTHSWCAERCKSSLSVPYDRDNRRAKAEELLRVAKECARAARLVPPIRAYDGSRIKILTCAALLAERAAQIELEGESWGAAYSPAAAYAVRLIDACESFKEHISLSGFRREWRAWALGQSGRVNDGIQQALAVREQQQKFPEYGFNLARLYGYRNNRVNNHAVDAQEAMTWLDFAVRMGWNDIAGMNKNPDFQSVRQSVETAKSFKELTKLQVVGAPAAGPPQFAANGLVRLQGPLENVVFTNKSAYRLTHVTITVNVIVPSPRAGVAVAYQDVTYDKEFLWINASASVNLEGILKDVNTRGWKYRGVKVQCDQGKAEALQ